MRHIVLALLMVFFVALSGCSDKAAGLYDIAQFEELQKNKKHATELYEEIIKKYPDSEYAKKAKERLVKLKEGANGAAK
ncbi:MAG: outer membrane protein assembly factor BamD [Nitrospirae bacterium]|nr:outer membrane protein assembly factor BamD [Nitrospirota bacterium]